MREKPLEITLGGKTHRIAPLTLGQILELQDLIDASAGGAEVLKGSAVTRHAMRIVAWALKVEPESFHTSDAKPYEFYRASAAVVKFAGFQEPAPGEAEGAAKKTA